MKILNILLNQFVLMGLFAIISALIGWAGIDHWILWTLFFLILGIILVHILMMIYHGLKNVYIRWKNGWKR